MTVASGRITGHEEQDIYFYTQLLHAVHASHRNLQNDRERVQAAYPWFVRQRMPDQLRRILMDREHVYCLTRTVPTLALQSLQLRTFQLPAAPTAHSSEDTLAVAADAMANQDEPFPQQLSQDTLLPLAAHGKANQDEPVPQRLYNQWEEGEYTDQHIIEEHGAAIWYKFLSKRHHRREAQRRLAREHEEWLNRDFSSDTD